MKKIIIIGGVAAGMSAAAKAKRLNPELEIVEEFKRLVELCHEKGISVILDWVANHTSWDHAWIKEHKEWYTQDSIGNIISPAGTGWNDVADLNYDNADMCLAMIDAMKYWIQEVGVDGFRCDAADYVPYTFWKQAVDSLRAIPNRKLLMLAEGKRKDHFDAGFDMTCVPYKYDKDLNQEIDMGVTGMGVGKWSKLYMQSPLGASSGSNTGINSVRMRFADVLLMYAEAVNELYGPRDDAKEALKRVRRRAFDAAQWTDKVESYVESLTNEADFFQAVMDERKWEFGGEGIRKYDLARWNKYGEVIYNLYNEMTNWGLVANGAYVPGIEKVPSNIYYKQVTDPEHSDRKVLDIVGIDEYGPGVGRPAGYTVLEYALGWRVLNKETQLYETLDAISWSFRGFINKNNDQLVKPTDPVRYLCPYPAKVITDHRGLIRNYYGY